MATYHDNPPTYNQATDHNLNQYQSQPRPQVAPPPAHLPPPSCCYQFIKGFLLVSLTLSFIGLSFIVVSMGYSLVHDSYVQDEGDVHVVFAVYNYYCILMLILTGVSIVGVCLENSNLLKVILFIAFAVFVAVFFFSLGMGATVRGPGITFFLLIFFTIMVGQRDRERQALHLQRSQLYAI